MIVNSQFFYLKRMTMITWKKNLYKYKKLDKKNWFKST